MIPLDPDSLDTSEIKLDISPLLDFQRELCDSVDLAKGS